MPVSPPRYIDRAASLLALCERHQALDEGNRVLELGTGWVHWEGTILGLFHDVDVTLFDVVDNRLWSAYRRYLTDFAQALDRGSEVCPARQDRARRILRAMEEARSFDDAYELLGATYVLDPEGDLGGFPEDTFSLVVSTDVLEHIGRAYLPRTLAETYRTLRPGGTRSTTSTSPTTSHTSSAAYPASTISDTRTSGGAATSRTKSSTSIGSSGRNG